MQVTQKPSAVSSVARNLAEYAQYTIFSRLSASMRGRERMAVKSISELQQALKDTFRVNMPALAIPGYLDDKKRFEARIRRLERYKEIARKTGEFADERLRAMGYNIPRTNLFHD